MTSSVKIPLPLYLDSKSKFRTGVSLDVDHDLCVASYNNSASLAIAKLSDKQHTRVEFEGVNKLVSYSFDYPQIVALGLNSEGNQCLFVYNVATAKRLVSLNLGSTVKDSVLFTLPVDSTSHLLVTANGVWKGDVGGSPPRQIITRKTPPNSIRSLSRVVGNKLLVSSYQTFELWDLKNGELLLSGSSKAADTFLLNKFTGEHIITVTRTELSIWKIGKQVPMTTALEVPIFSIAVEGNDLLAGNLQGVVSSYNLTTGRRVHDLNAAPVGIRASSDDPDAQRPIQHDSKSFFDQMKTRIVFLQILESDYVLSGLENGELSIWSKVTPGQEVPLKALHIRDKVSSIRLNQATSTCYIQTVKEDKTDELISWPVNVKKLSKVAVHVSTDSHSEMDGYLITLKDLKVKLNKKRHYFQLRGNILYEFKTNRETTPLGSYLIGPSSAVSKVPTTLTGKRAYFILAFNAKQQLFISAVEGSNVQWIEAFDRAIKASTSKSSWVIESTDLHFDEGVALGKGASSTVVKATLNGRDVAVKQFKTTNNKEWKNEVELYNAIQHECIVNVIGVCVKPPALVLEYLPRGSLFDAFHKDLLDRYKYSWKLFLKIATDVADAMNYLHTFNLNQVIRPILHRDLKPSNLLVNSLDASSNKVSVKLTDFGISQFNTEDTENPSTAKAGTFAYLAPEVLKSSEYSPKSDVYSFAILLWEMLTLKVPYAKQTNAKIEKEVTSDKRLPLPEATPAPIRQLIEQCWDSTAASRPSFRTILQRLLEIGATMLADNSINELVTDASTVPSRRNSRIGVFEVTKKLYGRTSAIHRILQIIRRFRGGTAELAVISGVSGMGKSVLIQRISDYASTQGFVCSGKWTVYHRKTPFFAIKDALRSLLATKLKSWDDTELNSWRTRLLYAFDDLSLNVLISLIPEISRIVGRDAPKDSPSVNKDQFLALMVKFLSVFATKEHPLIMSLDDLQWADSSSLQLLQTLFTDPTTRYLLVIGSFRDNEVDSAHPLTEALNAIVKEGVSAMTELKLKSLDHSHIVDLLVDTLRSDAKSVDDLATVVEDKTQGNPFFIQQYVQNLFRTSSPTGTLSTTVSSGLLMAKSDALRESKSVIDIIYDNIRELKPSVVVLLYLASCLDGTFSSNTINTLLKKIAVTVQDNKVQVQVERRSVPSEFATQRQIEDFLNEAVDKYLLRRKSKHMFEFVHDKIHEALFDGIPEASKKSIHLSIGKSFWAIINSDQRAKNHPDVGVFEAVHHMNEGASIVKEKKQILKIAAANLEAAKVANQTTAYPLALTYLNFIVDLLDVKKSTAAAWEESYTLAYQAATLLADCSRNIGDFTTSVEWAILCVEKAKTKAAKIEAYLLKSTGYEGQFNFVPNIQSIIDGLAVSGIIESFSVADFITNPKELIKLNKEVKDLVPDYSAFLSDALAKRMKNRSYPDGETTARHMLLGVGLGAATIFGLDHLLELFALLWTKMVVTRPNESVEPYGTYIVGMWQAHVKKNPEIAKKAWTMALPFLEPNHPDRMAVRQANFYDAFAIYTLTPFEEFMQRNRRNLQGALEEGNFLVIGYGLWNESYALFFSGSVSLDVMVSEEARIYEMTRGRQMNNLDKAIFLAAHMSKIWRGDESIDGEAWTSLASLQIPVLLNCFGAFNGLHGLLTRNGDRGQRMLKMGSKILDTGRGHFTWIYGNFFSALTALNVALQAPNSPVPADDFKDFAKGGSWLDLGDTLANRFRHHDFGAGWINAIVQLYDAHRTAVVVANQISKLTGKDAMLKDEQLVSVLLGYSKAIALAEAQNNKWLTPLAFISAYETTTRIPQLKMMSVPFIQDAIRRLAKWGARGLVNELKKSLPDVFNEESGQTTSVSESEAVVNKFSLLLVDRLSMAVSRQAHVAAPILQEKLGSRYDVFKHSVDLLRAVASDMGDLASTFDSDSSTTGGGTTGGTNSGPVSTDSSSSADANTPFGVTPLYGEVWLDRFLQQFVALLSISSPQGANIQYIVHPETFQYNPLPAKALRHVLLHIATAFTANSPGSQLLMACFGSKSRDNRWLHIQITNHIPQDLEVPSTQVSDCPPEVLNFLQPVEFLMQSLNATAKYQEENGRKTLVLSFDMTHQRIASIAVVVKNPLMTKLITTNLSLLGLDYQVLALHQVRTSFGQHQAVIMDQLPPEPAIVRSAREAHPWLRFFYLVSFDMALQQENCGVEDEWKPLLDEAICASPLDKVALTTALFTPRKDRRKAPKPVATPASPQLTSGSDSPR